MQRRDLIKLSSLVFGAAASASVSRALLAGAGSNPNALKTTFSDQQQTTIGLLSEMIIPTTDTPGALAAGVPDFIATIVGEWYEPNEREIFFGGLQALDKHCDAAEGKAFHIASQSARKAALDAQQELAAQYQAPSAAGAHPLARSYDGNTPFFTKLKELVVLGYYTSEVGAKQELIYAPMPGYFDGEVDFATVGRQWIS